MLFNAPIAVPRMPSDNRALWRRLFMDALDSRDINADTVSAALYAGAALAHVPVIEFTDALVTMGLRASPESFPRPWVQMLQSRVLDLGERALLSYPLASVAASWGWMPAPMPRLSLPTELDCELDPYGCDLLGIFGCELGEAPRFGHTPSQVRLALMKTAMSMGRPLAEVVTSLVARGVVFMPESVPAGCRETLRLTTQNQLVLELIASWQISQQRVAEVIPLKFARS